MHKNAFLMKSLASSGFFKSILALSGQISRLLVGRLNSERSLESNYRLLSLFLTDVLTKDENFIHLTPLICSQTS